MRMSSSKLKELPENLRTKIERYLRWHKFELPPSCYIVVVDDNYHYMDEDERYVVGIYEDCESAVAQCKEMVDEHILKSFNGHETEKAIWDDYMSFGEDPWIISFGSEKCSFSAWNYAKEKIKQLLAESER
jgi:hypothetical protein